MTGPLLVLGRETRTASGAIDLVALAASGELLLVEFKTGPSNPDFRAALAQLVDYGSDLWGMQLEQFEMDVATAYFAGHRCGDPRLKGLSSIETAAHRVWPDYSDEEVKAANIVTAWLQSRAPCRFKIRP